MAAKENLNNHWQNIIPSQQEKLSHLFASGEMSDVIFLFQDEDGPKQQLKVHSLVLSMASAVFQTMFYGPLKPPKNEEGEFEVEIHDDHIVFEQLIRYIYSSESVELTNVEDTLKLHQMADKYMIEAIKKHCELKLKELASSFKDAMSLLHYASLENSVGLLAVMRALIKGKDNEMLMTIGMGSVDVDLGILKHLLFNFELKTTEVAVFKAVYNWARFRLQHVKGASTNTDLVVDYLCSSGILRAIDFCKMTRHELFFDVVPTNVVTFEQANQFMKRDLTDIPECLIALPTLPRRLTISKTIRKLVVKIPQPITCQFSDNWFIEMVLVPETTLILVGINCEGPTGPFEVYLLADEPDSKSEDSKIFKGDSVESLGLMRGQYLFQKDVRQVIFIKCDESRTLIRQKRAPSVGRSSSSGGSLFNLSGGVDLAENEVSVDGKVCNFPVAVRATANMKCKVTLLLTLQFH